MVCWLKAELQQCNESIAPPPGTAGFRRCWNRSVSPSGLGRELEALPPGSAPGQESFTFSSNGSRDGSYCTPHTWASQTTLGRKKGNKFSLVFAPAMICAVQTNRCTKGALRNLSIGEAVVSVFHGWSSLVVCCECFVNLFWCL